MERPSLMTEGSDLLPASRWCPRVLEESAERDTCATGSSQAGAGGAAEALVPLPRSPNSHPGPSVRGLPSRFTSGPLIKRKQLAHPAQASLWAAWLPLTQRLALQTSRKVEHPRSRVTVPSSRVVEPARQAPGLRALGFRY